MYYVKEVIKNMKLTLKYKINLTKEQEDVLRDLCFYATKLYNTDNYMRRDEWEKTGKIPSWYDQKKALINNHWKNMLPSQTAQAVIKTLQDNYVLWFKLRKTDKDAKPPRFRSKNMLSPLTFYQQFKIDGDIITLTMSRKYRKEKGIDKLILRISKWRDINGTPIMCNILHNGKHWMAHVVYEISEAKIKQSPEIMAVDIGIKNLAAIVDTCENTYLFSGGTALEVQHYFNKEIAKAQSKTDKQKLKSKKVTNMHKKKSKQINQIIHTTTKRIIEIAENNNIGTIIAGDIKNIRKDKKWNKNASQKLHSWGFAKLTKQIEYKAKLSGIRFEMVNEKDTSKTCSVCGTIKKSNRKHRGLYKCKCGNVMNADINGAANILKKYLQENNISRSIGNVAMPVVYKNYNVIPV